MKILAIRGKNLASLAGDFEVDFSQTPLAEAGLFAISGPTGSGKSTLLDALCLALYGDTPRLANATRGQIPDVLNEQIAPSDPRTLLRRGKAEGYAEVDFVGIDQTAYRARWSIRRARKQPDGRLQNADYLLTRVADGQPIGGTLKSEVHGHIERLLGLSFPQFTRAVLLAQNDFATFLKADDDERAALLQTLTGTERFERLSAQIFIRAALEKSHLDDLNRQLADTPPLSDEARALLTTAQAGARAAVDIREKHIAALESAQRWWQEQTRLENAQNQAQGALEQANQHRQAADARRIYLAQVDAVAPARPLQDACTRLEAEAEHVAKQLQAQATKMLAANLAQATTAASLLQAHQQRDAASQAYKQAQPEIEAAKQLDTEINTLTPQCQSAQQALEAENKVVAKHEVERTAILKQREQTAKAHSETHIWLTQHAPLETLAADWAHWEYLLKQAEATVSSAQTAQAELTRLQQTEIAAHAAANAQRAMLETCSAKLQTAIAADHAANAVYARFNPDQLANQKATAETLRKHLDTGQTQWTHAQERLLEHATVEREATALRSACQENETTLQTLQRQRPELEGRLQQAETALKRVQTACNQDVDGLRAGLETEHPCPVCGSLEHPYAESGARHQLNELLKAHQVDYDTLRQTLNQMVQAETSHAATLKAQSKQLSGLDARLLELTTRRDAAMQAWQHTLHQSALNTALANLAETEIAAWFKAQRETNEATLQDLSKQENGLRAAQKARDAAQAKSSTAQQAEQTARAASLAAQEALNQSAQALQATQQRIQQALGTRDDLLAQLDAVLNQADGENAWRNEWLAQPQTFRQARQTAVSTWLKQQKAQENQTRALETLLGQIDAVSALLAKASEIAADAQNRFAQQSKEIDTKRLARAQLLGGKSVAEVEATLTRALDAAQNQCNAQEAAAAQAATAATQTKTTHDLIHAGLLELHAKAIEATEKRATWLENFNQSALNSGSDSPSAALDIDGLKQRLSLEAAWLTSERSALNRLDQAVATAATVLNERQAQWLAHREKQSSAPEHQDLTLIVETLAQQRPIMEQEKAAAIEKELMLRQDDERRLRLAGLLETLRAQADKTEIWAKLNDLIGSADGRKFRRIAQQYTLDVLLGYANRHLADLSRRYRLQRLPDGLTLLVVDQDMGDERRSVHSLSGGESFLVSLALALGLASLSSHSVKVESLFIDEGFGSLDSETLAVAMDALDNLQTQGRKVGVISHVHEMAERIGVQIQIKPQSGGQSQLNVVG